MPTPSTQPLDEATRRLRALRDPALPALPVVLGAEAQDLLDAAIPPPDSAGPAVLRRVGWRPGRSLNALFARPTEVAAAGGSAHHEELMVASVDRGTGGGDGTEIFIRGAFDDPDLPGLRSTMSGADLDDWLDAMGVTAGLSERRLIAYRPGRRAVVEVRRGEQRLFVKIVRPGATGQMRGRHEEFGRIAPVPRILGTADAAGIVVMQALDGETAWGALMRGRTVDPAAIHELLARIHELPVSERVVASPIERVDAHVRELSLLLPEEAPRLAALAEAIGPEGQPATTTIHGDLHGGQFLVAGGAVVGLLDLDVVGMGRPADDPANALAHIAALIPTSEGGAPVIAPWLEPMVRFANDFLALSDTIHDPVDLRRRIAAALLGLAAAQFQSVAPDWPGAIRQRLAAAESWLESSRAADQGAFMSASSSAA